MFYYLISHEGTLTEIQKDKRMELHDFYNELDCDCIQSVKCVDNDTFMILDEEGKLKDKPVNDLASILYGAFPFDYIVGDVILCTIGTFGEYGERDFTGFTTSQMSYIQGMIATEIATKGGCDF